MAADTIHLHINPTAGRGRASRRQRRIIELLEQRGIRLEVHTSSAAGDIESQILQHVNEGATRVIVAGGDGSVHEAVNGLLRSDNSASLGVIPTGTGNDFVKACDITLNWEHATRLLADRIVANAIPRQIDAGRCNDRYFANGAGIGFDAKVNRVAQSIRLPIGDLVYLLAIFRTMIEGISSPRVQIEADSFSWDGPLTLAAICNGQWVGGMFHIAPAASNADHIFDLLIAKPVTRRRILTLLPKLISGNHLQEKEIVNKPVTRLTIKADSALPSHLDGEIQPLQTTFEIAVLPGALSLL
jgi:YegS/Rv2252/BmrU family lipid kinase